jgi:integrase
MAIKKYHHLYKRDNIWYFRKGKTRLTLETTVATEAIRLRDRLLENYRLTGQFVVPVNDDNCPTFGQVAKEWATIHSKKVKHSTWRDYRSSMNTHVLPAFKDMPINAIAYLDVEMFISALSCGGKRINNILVPMRSIFNMAYKHGYVLDNVMLKVENRSLEQPDIFPLSYDEAMLVLDAVEPFYRPYSIVRFFTGLRAGEIDGLLWSDYKQNMTPMPKLHVNKSFVYGQEGSPKTKKSKRYVDCLDMVVEALEEQRKLTGKSSHIFLSHDGSRMNPDHYRNVVWTKALEKAGLEYRPPIQTRHSFATMMISAGEDIGWVQSMMGHSSLQMIFTRYYAWMPRKTRNDGNAFQASLGDRAVYESEEPAIERMENVIPLFRKNGT